MSDPQDNLAPQTESSTATGPIRLRRSELPIARPKTGQSLPSLTNADAQRILDEEAAGLTAGKGEPLSAFQRLQPFIGVADSGGQQLSENTGRRFRETFEARKRSCG